MSKGFMMTVVRNIKREIYNLHEESFNIQCHWGMEKRNEWKGIPCSWEGQQHKKRCYVLCVNNLTHKVNAIPIKISIEWKMGKPNNWFQVHRVLKKKSYEVELVYQTVEHITKFLWATVV